MKHPTDRPGRPVTHKGIRLFGGRLPPTRPKTAKPDVRKPKPPK